MSTQKTKPEEATKRSIALEAAIRTAMEQERSRRWHPTVNVPDVRERLEAKVSDRTIRRALQDARALGWVSKRHDRSTKFEPGEKAEVFGPDE
ncbi:hypothetical protein [Halocalculus aciditolerans]|uniref:HTH gntR-type domain-containing protein n=1 Tax=Halocalculus aciditolerans TaxID=1383812 RepID=A0A830FQD3_9EURY|nr:hypothetical protein [Halocalculus aciditolerans]GGL70224.1 hypothetical protein GCM10009039_30330 [Halocalculus aciditolerans]